MRTLFRNLLANRIKHMNSVLEKNGLTFQDFWRRTILWKPIQLCTNFCSEHFLTSEIQFLDAMRRTFQHFSSCMHNIVMDIWICRDFYCGWEPSNIHEPLNSNSDEYFWHCSIPNQTLRIKSKLLKKHYVYYFFSALPSRVKFDLNGITYR